jgi:hypothetical protein
VSRKYSVIADTIGGTIIGDSTKPISSADMRGRAIQMGGRVVVAAAPREAAQCPASGTAPYLARFLDADEATWSAALLSLFRYK